VTWTPPSPAVREVRAIARRIAALTLEKAREQDPHVEVNLSDYSYPGPKPRSKETAIAMLADGVEAASRVLLNPTPSRVRNLVERLVQKKVEEGQLDDANLTFRELSIIREKFTSLLTGILHARIEYPTFQVNVEEESEPAKPHALEDLGSTPGSTA